MAFIFLKQKCTNIEERLSYSTVSAEAILELSTVSPTTAIRPSLADNFNFKSIVRT